MLLDAFIVIELEIRIRPFPTFRGNFINDPPFFCIGKSIRARDVFSCQSKCRRLFSVEQRDFSSGCFYFFYINVGVPTEYNNINLSLKKIKLVAVER